MGLSPDGRTPTNALHTLANRLGVGPGMALLALTLLPAASAAKQAPATLQWHAQVQGQLNFAPAFDDPATGADEGVGERILGWRARRLRVSLTAKRSGWKSGVKVALDGGGSSWGMVGVPASGSLAEANPTRLLSGWIQRDLGFGLKFRLGQFKRQISQDYLVSSSDLRLLERSFVSEEAGGKRDVGAMVRGTFWRKRINLVLLALNGNGSNNLRNNNDNLRLEARLGVDPLGRMNLGKGHIGRKPKLHIGGAVARWRENKRRKTGGYVLTEYDQGSAASADLAVSWQGIELRAEGFSRWSSPIDAQDATRIDLGFSEGAHNEALDELYRRRRGWYGQIAWGLPWLSQVEIAARAQQWWPDHNKPEEGSEAVDLALSWRSADDDVKLQTGWMALRQHRQDQDPMDAWLLLAQLQLVY